MSENLKPDWWRHPLPTTLGHPKNYVMNFAQMKVYEAVMLELATLVTKEHNNVRRAVLRIEQPKRFWPSFDPLPYPVTLNRLLQFLVAESECHILLLQTSMQLMKAHQPIKE